MTKFSRLGEGGMEGERETSVDFVAEVVLDFSLTQRQIFKGP